MRILTTALALSLFAMPGPRAAAQAPPAAADLAARLQAHYATVKNFTAKFTQTYQGVFTAAQKSEDSGDVKVLKPDMMRWTYNKPTKKEWLADGRYVYWFDATNSPKEVQRWVIPRGEQVSTALLLLAGRGDLVRDFTPSLVPDAPAGEWRLKLVPKSTQADFSSLILMINPQSLSLAGFSAKDDSSTNTFRFEGLRENAPVTEADFTFVLKPGMKVIDNK